MHRSPAPLAQGAAVPAPTPAPAPTHRTLADAVRARPAYACSGIPTGKLPLFRRLSRSRDAAGEQPTLLAAEAEELASAAIANAAGVEWAASLWLPSNTLLQLQAPACIYERAGRCRVFVARHSGQVPHVPHGARLAVKEVALQLDAAAITGCRPAKLPLDAYGELQGLRSVAGNAGCQRLLAWSVVQAAGSGSGTGFKLLLVTKHCPGGTLQQLLAQTMQPGGWPVCIRGYLELLLQVVETLAALQADGVVHGDIKPDNIFLDEKGAAIVADWEGAVTFPRRVRPHSASERRPDTMARAYVAPFMRTERYAGLEQLLPEAAAAPPGSPLRKLWSFLDERSKADMSNGGRVERFVSFASDVYSMGIMISDASQLCSYDRVRPEVREAMAAELRYLAAECCQPLPWQRLTMRQLLSRMHTIMTAARQVRYEAPPARVQGVVG